MSGWDPKHAERVEEFFGMPKTSGLTPEEWYAALRKHLNTGDLPTDEEFMDYVGRESECPQGPHRPPQGPNEDVAQCGRCLSLTFAMRPEGETFGHHLPDCSLPERHQGYCVGGGSGHPPAKKIRGY